MSIAETLAALAEIESLQDQLKAKLAKQRSQLEIDCVACGGSHKIADLVVVQTYWYTSPSGCNEGDYWNQGELQFICPENDVRNRLLFNNYDVPWEDRRKYDFNPAEQFSRIYRPLFAEIREYYDGRGAPYHFVNNKTVDEQRERYGLVQRGAVTK